jgi:uncharacterized tellurite resistance protein B-like protein
MTTPLSPKDRFHIELLKLLLHVAWSDDEIDPREARLILGVARQWQVPAAELELLERCLDLGQPMPAPDLGLLRTHREDVLLAVRGIIGSDAQVRLAEKEVFAQIQELLGPAAR